jgi:hypothetical protein
MTLSMMRIKKSWAVVRRLVGYQRLEAPIHLKLELESAQGTLAERAVQPAVNSPSSVGVFPPKLVLQWCYTAIGDNVTVHPSCSSAATASAERPPEAQHTRVRRAGSDSCRWYGLAGSA